MFRILYHERPGPEKHIMCFQIKRVPVPKGESTLEDGRIAQDTAGAQSVGDRDLTRLDLGEGGVASEHRSRQGPTDTAGSCAPTLAADAGNGDSEQVTSGSAAAAAPV